MRLRHALRWLRACVACVAVCACDLGSSAGPPPTAQPPPEADVDCPETFDPRGAPLDEVARCEDALTRRASRWEGTPDGVAAARRAAEIARARAVREDDREALGRARALLVEASRRRSLEGACEAGLELAGLEARDRVDLGAAYVEAHRVVRRFDDAPHAACVARARHMLAILAPYRPAAPVLAAIDADPDAEDPSVGLASPHTTDASATQADPFASWASAQPAARSSSLRAIEVYGADRGQERRGSVRVVLALSGVAPFEPAELPADDALPRRFAILLRGTSLGAEIAPSTTIEAGGLVRVRVAAEGPGTRVTLDLSPSARPVLFVLPEPFRVIVDVSEGDAVPSVSAPGPRAMSLLVLDPGHGGDDYGARAFGLEEQDITLDLALRVRDILRARMPSTRVVLTREEDRFVSLEQRTAMANAVGADAFVSIHLNAAWEDVVHGGVTTFVLDTTDDRQAVLLAARENGTSETDVGALARILAGLHRDEQSLGSRALAQHLHVSTLAGGRRHLPRLYDRGVRSAMFHVLVGATMPAVLVEASFMTRRQEADALRTEAYRQSLAEGIADGIVAYARGDAAPETR